MRGGRLRRWGAVLCLVTVGVVSGCQKPPDDSLAGKTTPPGYGVTFLGVGECGSRGPGVREVSCGSEKAAARVLARHVGVRGGGTVCPAPTDFVLHISENLPALDEDGDGSVPRGFACMRNLQAPHPGDPGQGGGPRTVVGDCVSTARTGQVKETPCDGSGQRAPQFTVATVVASREECPPATRLYVQLGGDRAVGCARRL